MDDFTTKRFENTSEYSQHDVYMNDLQKKIQARASSGLIDKSLDSSYQENNDNTKRAKERGFQAAQFWGIALFSITNSALVYAPSIKFVRKVFKLKGFLNIHFAILPILANWNAISFGVLYGIYINYDLKNRYPVLQNLQQE